jgi:ABC-type transport system involved in multi-copper enzyme maturation permease subunit
MKRLIQTEFLKLRTVRLPYGLLAGTAGLTALVATLIAFRSGGAIRDLPSLATAAGLTNVITATRFGLLFATVLGVVVASGEFRHGTATPTYLGSPNRNHVMLAKITTAAGIGLLFGLVASGVATGVGAAFAAGKGYAIAIPAMTMLRFALGAALAAGLFAGIGVAIGSLIRNQVAGIVGVFAWGFVIEQILAGVFPSVGRFLPYTAAQTLGGGTITGATALPFAGAALLLAGVVVTVGAVASRTTLQRDIA